MNNTRGQNKLGGRYFQGLSLLRYFAKSTAEKLQTFRRIVLPPVGLLGPDEGITFFRNVVTTYHSTWPNILEDTKLKQLCCDNLKSHSILSSPPIFTK
jgi:hypothetical protein